ncbi:MAG: DUF4412 domain-containing protein [Sediminibacterium sp.]|nr:DUF4412 domain-containing protein [Sediminibacterium sp.]
MKKIVLLAAFAGLGVAAMAQDCITIKMMNKVDGLPAEYAAMGETETVVYIKGEKSKTEISSMMMSMTMLNDGEKTTTIQEAMGNKMGWVMTKAEAEEASKTDATNPNKPKVEYTTEKKTIAGYECTKVLVTTTGKDKQQNTATVWVTDKIKNPNSGKKTGRMMGPDLTGVNGFPLETSFKQNQGGMDITVTSIATEVKTDKIDDSTFTIDTNGYKMMTYKEMKEQIKAQSGK